MDRAVHAKDILKDALIKKGSKEQIGSYLKQFDHVIGTTAKLGNDYNISRVALDPKQLAEKIKLIQNAGGKSSKKIAILFGRECHGLTNEEISLCDFTVTIPSSREYPTLNLSHACAVILYEIFQAVSDEKEKTNSGIPYAGRTEKRQIEKLLDEILKKMVFPAKDKKETQRKVWKRVLGKAVLTRREAFAVMGFFKKALGRR